MSNAFSTDVLFIASLKVTLICVVTGTFVPVGSFPVTVGGVVSLISTFSNRTLSKLYASPAVAKGASQNIKRPSFTVPVKPVVLNSVVKFCQFVPRLAVKSKP